MTGVHAWLDQAEQRAADPDADCVEIVDTDLPKALAAIRAVMDRHVDGYGGDCKECGLPWPCPTVRAITAALLGEEDGRG